MLCGPSIGRWNRVLGAGGGSGAISAGGKSVGRQRGVGNWEQGSDFSARLVSGSERFCERRMAKSGEGAAAVSGAETGFGAGEVAGGEQGNGVGGASLQQTGLGGAGESAVVVDQGFTRPEMFTKPLVGSVEHYDRHVFLCYKEPESWPAKVEAADFDRLPRFFFAALLARNNDMPKKTRLTICEGRDGTDSSSGDVLIFPEMLRYRGLTHFDVESFVEDVLVKGKEWVGSSKPEPLTGSFVFVCAHGTRDARCGTCGPVLIEKFHEEIALRGLKGQISVRPCSHIGGHRYAGNVIIFSSTGTGSVSGHWYGYVVPEDVPALLDEHIGNGEIIDRLWRGQMGLAKDEQKLAQKERQCQRGGQNGCPCVESQDRGVDAKRQTGSTCCQTDKSEKAVKLYDGKVNGHTNGDVDSPKAEYTAPQVSSTQPMTLTSSFLRWPKWIQTWEREDTQAALAVAGAAAFVALAVHAFRRSSSA